MTGKDRESAVIPGSRIPMGVYSSRIARHPHLNPNNHALVLALRILDYLTSTPSLSSNDIHLRGRFFGERTRPANLHKLKRLVRRRQLYPSRPGSNPAYILVSECFSDTFERTFLSPIRRIRSIISIQTCLSLLDLGRSSITEGDRPA